MVAVEEDEQIGDSGSYRHEVRVGESRGECSDAVI
jgi:hypothetical protein